MGKKKLRRFRHCDVNNLPSSSEKKKVESNDVNTSSDLSVTPSKANESMDSLSTQYDDEMSNESKNDSQDMSKPLSSADNDHRVSESGEFAKSNVTSCNTNKESTENITTEQYSDDVANKLQHVTINSQNTTKSDPNNYSRKNNYDDKWRTKLHNRDYGGKDKNYTKKTNDFYKDDKSKFNQRNSNQNKYAPTYVNDRNYTSRSSNDFNKSDNPYQRGHNKNQKYDTKHSFRNQNSNVQNKQELGTDKVKYEPKYHNSASGPWEEHPSKEIPSTFSKGHSRGQYEQRNWDGNKRGAFVEKQITVTKEDDSSWDSTLNNDNSWNDNAVEYSLEQNKKDNEENNQNDQDAIVENETTITDESNSLQSNSGDNDSSRDDPCWDGDAVAISGTELNAYAKSFVPIETKQKRAEYAEGEAGQPGDSLDDHSANNYQRKSERPDQEKQQRRGTKFAQNQYKKREILKSKETDYPMRYSEGNNWEKKENSRTINQSRYSLETGSKQVDGEYRKFLDEERNFNEIEFIRVVEIQQDLFAMSKEYSLAHCVAEDMRMGSGIAVSFKRDFKEMDVLLNQRQKQGGLAVLENETDVGVRYIYYLVTKRVSTGKPTYETLWSSLKKMRDHIKEQDVKKLAIPRLGCGLDRLEWSRVKHMIEFLFKDIEIEITVCNFQQTEDSPEKPLNQTCKVVHVKKPVADIEEETIIIYLSTQDGHVSSEMEQLSKKFFFLEEFKRAQKPLGNVIKYQDPKKYFILYGCIVKKTEKDPFDFVNFCKCISQIGKNNKKDGYVYVGIQAIKDDHDDLINDKIVTILRNYFHKIDVYVCWDGDLVGQMPISTAVYS